MFGRKKKKEESPWANLVEPPQDMDFGPDPDDEPKPTPYIVPGKKMKEQPEDATYMIGTLDDGRVQLRVGYPTSVILTMNNVAVRKMIKLLEAAMLEEGDTSNEC
jgi:hypothetical protein